MNHSYICYIWWQDEIVEFDQTGEEIPYDDQDDDTKLDMDDSEVNSESGSEAKPARSILKYVSKKQTYQTFLNKMLKEYQSISSFLLAMFSIEELSPYW